MMTRAEADMLIKSLSSQATNPLDIIPAESIEVSSVSIDALGVRSRYLEAVILSAAGIVASGIVRILGAGSKKNNISSIAEYNSYNAENLCFPMRENGLIIVADDIFGGVFCLNIGKFSDILHYEDGAPFADIRYLDPKMLSWQPLNIDYPKFLSWAAAGSIEDFYDEGLIKLKNTIPNHIGFNEMLSCSIPMWTKEISYSPDFWQKADSRDVVDKLLGIAETIGDFR